MRVPNCSLIDERNVLGKRLLIGNPFGRTFRGSAWCGFKGSIDSGYSYLQAIIIGAKREIQAELRSEGEFCPHENDEIQRYIDRYPGGVYFIKEGDTIEVYVCDSLSEGGFGGGDDSTGDDVFGILG